jgi:hypothetical protein
MEKIGESTFTIQNATKAGLVNKQVWKDYPRNMLFARAVSNGARLFCADIITAYTPEEVEDIRIVNPAPLKEAIEVTVEGEVKKDGS